LISREWGWRAPWRREEINLGENLGHLPVLTAALVFVQKRTILRPVLRPWPQNKGAKHPFLNKTHRFNLGILRPFLRLGAAKQGRRIGPEDPKQFCAPHFCGHGPQNSPEF
jgi:hypothetical protein